MFEFRGVSARYNGVPVLNDINLSIGRGEKVALIGKSGSGKSTLLGLLYEQQSRCSALIPQRLGLVEMLSVFHNIYMGRLDRYSTIYNIANLIFPMPRQRQGVIGILQQLDMEEKMFAPAGELSGGQQQRTAIARALYRKSEILLGDEPVSSLDERQSRQILDILFAAHDTVVVALHHVSFALEYADRVIALNNRRIALDAPTAGLCSDDLVEFYQDE